MHKILMVGGNFDNDGGRPSGLFAKIYNAIKSNLNISVNMYNGGYFEDLKNNIFPTVNDYNIVFWAPNVPNTEEKIRNIKEINPKAILISTKRNNDEYDFAELITRALAQKSNLVVEFSKSKENPQIYNMMIFDPLGNMFYNGTSVDDMASALFKRAVKLTTFTRIGSKQIEGDAPIIPNEEEFFSFARSCSDIFHNLINPSNGTTRFLGNMSFRCQNGFPSFRGKDNLIYVSRRNVDKRFIDANSFVATYMDENGKVCYYGENKPSVDTPVQQRLYNLFPQMNYMIHAHCYFGNGALLTSEPIPCGAIEEVQEIVNVTNACKNDDFIAINLIGHGCILMAKEIKSFTDLMDDKNNHFVKRPVPESFMV